MKQWQQSFSCAHPSQARSGELLFLRRVAGLSKAIAETQLPAGGLFMDAVLIDLAHSVQLGCRFLTAAGIPGVPRVCCRNQLKRRAIDTNNAVAMHDDIRNAWASRSPQIVDDVIGV